MADEKDCPSQFAGQQWSVWTEHLGRDSPVSEDDDVAIQQVHAMRLPREDMEVFGHCPERDPFYTVLCEVCNKLVKPQYLKIHMDLWHKVSPLETAHGLDQPEKTVKCTVLPKTVTSGKPTPGNLKIKVKKLLSGGVANVPMDRLMASNQAQPCGANILESDVLLPLPMASTDKLVLQAENSGVGRSQSVSTGPVALQVSGMDGSGVHLPSPTGGSAFVRPGADLGSLPTPTSLSPDLQMNGAQNSCSNPPSPSCHMSDPSLQPLIDMAIDNFELPLADSFSMKTPVIYNGSCQLPEPPEELAKLEFVPRLEEVSWLRSPPKPVTVCSFSSRKLGGVEANNRRVELFYHGLKTALSQGCIRIPTLYSVQQRKRFLLFDTSQW